MKLGRLLRYTVDLDKPILKTILQDFFVTENKNAHTFRIKLMRGGEAIELSSGSVAAYFTRYKDRFSTPVGGSVEGDEIVVTLSPACYVMRTMFCLTINIPLDDGELCIFAGEGSMLLNREDAIYDPDAEIPSLQDILAQIEATKQAAVAANTAAQSANQAASAATAAAESASKWATAEATATPVSAESQPTVTVAESDGKKVLSFGIPAGKTPNITFSAATGAAGTQVQIQQSGTPENPNVDLTIPRGDTGVHVGPDEPTDPNVNVWIDPDAEDAGDGVTDAETLGGKPPEYYMPANGTARDAEKLGGKAPEYFLPASGTAADSAKLGGKAPEHYLQPRNLLDNGDFSNPVNQRGETNYTGNTYTIDRWRIWEDTTLGVGDGFVSISAGGSLYQYIEAAGLKDANHTLAVCDRNGVVTCLVANPQSNYTYSNGLGLGRTDDGNVTVSLDAGEYIWAALYEGEYTTDSLPPYVPKGYATELAECQMYFYKLGGLTYSVFGVGHVVGNYIARVNVKLPRMRMVNPSLSYNNYMFITSGNFASIVESIELDTASATEESVFLSVYCKDALNDIIGRAAILQARDNASARITFSADL